MNQKKLSKTIDKTAIEMDLIKALRLYISKMIEDSGPGMKVCCDIVIAN